jgi:hypothetical protein
MGSPVEMISKNSNPTWIDSWIDVSCHAYPKVSKTAKFHVGLTQKLDFVDGFPPFR